MKKHTILKRYTPMFITIQALLIAGVIAMFVFGEPQMSYFIHVPTILIVIALLVNLAWSGMGFWFFASAWSDRNKKDTGLLHRLLY